MVCNNFQRAATARRSASRGLTPLSFKRDQMLLRKQIPDEPSRLSVSLRIHGGSAGGESTLQTPAGSKPVHSAINESRMEFLRTTSVDAGDVGTSISRRGGLASRAANSQSLAPMMIRGLYVRVSLPNVRVLSPHGKPMRANSWSHPASNQEWTDRLTDL